MSKEGVQTAKVTSSSAVYSGACKLYGFLLGMDGVNNATVTVYNNASAASGDEVVPTNEYDASALGLQGFMAGVLPIECRNGIYVDVSGSNVEVVVLFRPK